MNHRHQCEVRHVLSVRAKNRESVANYFDLVEKKRGIAAVTALKTDAKNQWELGNRGERGNWK